MPDTLSREDVEQEIQRLKQVVLTLLANGNNGDRWCPVCGFIAPREHCYCDNDE